jgi:hypothetical protein
MKNHTHHLAGFGLVLALALAPALKANLDFHVDIDTSSLVSAPNSPFYLDLQLNEGSGSLANSVQLTNIWFDNGNATGSPMSWGQAGGTLGTSIWLQDDPASPFNEILQGFSDGTTAIHFEVSVSQNAAGVTPDEFAVAILDSETGFPQIGTNAPDGVSLVTLNIDANNTLADVSAFSSTEPAGVIASVGTPVPEASTMGFAFGAFALGLVGVRRWSRRRAV